jgi:ectoine hydroxylase-related dioxygenase (phytanoyl-CoA dioxygenase family)
VRWFFNARLLDDTLWALATDPELGAAAAQLLGTQSVSIIEDQLLDKPAGGGAPVNYHQDYMYWQFSTSTSMISCWIALIDMTPELGPIEIVRGSHLWGGAGGKPNQLIEGDESELMAALSAVLPQGAEIDVVEAVLPGGAAVFFHGLTFHGSRRNRTDRDRRALSLHWAAEECLMDRHRIEYLTQPWAYAGLRSGDRLVNRYMPQTFPVRR